MNKVGKVRCIGVKNDKTQCTRMVEGTYCFQHLDKGKVNECKTLKQIKTDIGNLDSLPDDVLQHVVNPYLDYTDEIPLAQLLIDDRIDFKIDSHLSEKIEYFEDNSVKSITSFLDNKVIKYEEWYPNGNQKILNNYTIKKGSSVEDGLQYRWNSNGDIASIKSYKTGVLNGPFKVYYRNGQLEFVDNYVNGVKEGIQTDYKFDGNKKSESIFKNGIEIKRTPFNY